MDRRQRVRRAIDQRLTPAAHEAAVRAIMEDRIRVYLEKKGLSEETKQCARCRLYLPKMLFHRSSHSSDGLSYQCNGCRSIVAAEGYARRKARLSIVGGRRVG